jgi:predicted nucleic acid-binding protein
VPFVLDNSVTMAWCFADEISPYTQGIRDHLDENPALVPIIWPFEVANVLLVAERRGRLTEAQTGRFLEFLSTMPIAVDAESEPNALQTVLTGRVHGLTAYDACYLELAMRQGLPLATQDGQLRAAATRAGVALL